MDGLQSRPGRLLIMGLCAVASVWAQPLGRQRRSYGEPLPAPLPEHPGVRTAIASSAGGEQGIAVRVVAPEIPRYRDGAPIAVTVAGGHDAGAARGRPDARECGVVTVFFAFPGGEGSGGTYDVRGPSCILALRDVTRFALGMTRDRQGRRIDDLIPDVPLLHRNVGLVGLSHGGNACGAVMGLYGEQLDGLAWYVSWESPYGEGIVDVELGSRRDGRLNPAYNPAAGTLDLSCLAYDPTLKLYGFNRLMDPRSRAALNGGFVFDMDGDGVCRAPEDFVHSPLVFDVGQGEMAWYSPRILAEAERRGLVPAPRPAHVPTLAQAGEFWRYREASGFIPDAVQRRPGLAVIVAACQTDHVQIAPDHPHIITQVNGFVDAGARFVRLNPDRCYVEWLLDRDMPVVRDNPAGRRYDRRSILDALNPNLPVVRQALVAAAICEAADRSQWSRFGSDLEEPLCQGPGRGSGARLRRPHPAPLERWERPR